MLNFRVIQGGMETRKSRLTPDQMVSMYCNDKLSAAQIAPIAGICGNAVLYHLRKAGVTRPTARLASLSELLMLYDEGLSPEKMSAEVGMHANSIRYHLRKAGVLKKGGWGNRKTPTSELIRLYRDEKYSLKEIAKLTGMTKAPIRGRLVRAGVQMRSRMARGWASPRRAPTEHPTTHDIAWAAGVYEGEGSVLVGTRSYGRFASVSLTQKDKWLCQRLRALFGGIVKVTIHNGREYDYWRLTGPRGVGFLMTIYGFLSPRRQMQIRTAFLTTGVLTDRTVTAVG